MAVTRLLHFIPDSGIRRNHKSHQQLKCSVTRDKSHLSVDHKSSLISDHDLLSRSLSDCVKRPICSTQYRYNALKCRCSFLPESIAKIPFVRSATMAITGPSTPLPSPPSIPNLIMAVSVLVFFLGGLQPLIRTSRNMFLRKDDTSWRRSTTHYLLISYLQPILLWLGVALVCRALDPVVLPTKAGRLIKERVITFVRSLSTVLTFAYCVSCAVQRAHKVFVETNEDTEAGSMGFHLAGKAVYTSVWIAALSLFMELLGFSAKKWLTAGGLGTVLLTLAGREIFTNFLSSVTIQATRPFVVNEWIQTKIEGYEVSGTVEDVGWWSPTLIRGEDREAVYIPNHKFTMNIVRNLSQKTHWRIRASLAISHLDVNKINTIVADMRKVLAKNPQVEQQKLHRRVFLDTINPENQALTILISCFVKTSHHEEYLCVKEAILLDLLRVITHHGARLATPIRSIQKHYSDPEMDIPFSESVFSRDHVPPNRPFFLIEPSYKINGEDSTKARNARGGGDSTEDGKMKETSASKSGTGETQPTSDSKAKEKSASQSSTGDTSKSGTGETQPTSDSKGKEKSASQSSTGEASKSGIAALDQDFRSSKSDSKLKETSTSQSKPGEKSKSDEDGLSSRPQSSTPDSKADAKLKGSSTSQSKTGEDSKQSHVSSSSEGSDNKSSKASSGSSQQKQTEKPKVEENIVLEVALDGLKRTLPIEGKEVAKNRNSTKNGDGAPTINKVDTDN